MSTARARKQDDDAETLGWRAERLGGTVIEVSGQAGDRLATLADNAGEAVRSAEHGLRGSSDQRLGIVGGATVGFTCGLLLGGAHRVMVVLSLLPVALVAWATLDRLDRVDGERRARSQQGRSGS